MAPAANEVTTAQHPVGARIGVTEVTISSLPPGA